MPRKSRCVPLLTSKLPDYFQLSAAGDAAAGTGLGLPISRSIIEAHEGTLWVAPGSPHGARFGFSLPVARGTSRKAR